MSRHFQTVVPLLASLLAAAAVSAQSVPALMNYQGRLTDEAGQPLPSGTYAVQFRLWDKAVGGQPGEMLVWGEQHDVTLVDGVFNVILGAPGGVALPGGAVNSLRFAFDGAERYLGLTLARLHDGTVLSGAQRREIVPRQQLLSAPFAVEAGRAHSLVKELADALCPPGSILPYGGDASTAPDGWILCDGRPLPIATYGRLHAAIGFAWGNPGAGQFRVPDLRGLFLRGVDGSPVTGESGRDPDRGDAARSQIHPGANFGNRVGSWQPDGIASHSHDVWSLVFNGNAWGTGGNPENPYNSNGLLTAWEPNPGAQPPQTYYGATRDGERYISSTGGAETRPKNAYVNYLIKD